MAFVHSKNAHLDIEDATSTTRNLSPFLDSVSGLPGATNLSDTTAFGAGGHKFIPGLENATFSTAGHFDPDTDAVHEIIAGMRTGNNGPYAFNYGPAGNASGAPRLFGEAWVSGYDVNAAVADKLSISVEFQVNGQVFVGTFA